MKIQQQPEFQPITITLESAEEADVFYDMVNTYGANCDLDDSCVEMAVDLSNWFCTNAQLGGNTGE